MPVAKTVGGKPLQIALLAYPGMNLIDLSGPVQAFATACRVAAPVLPAHPRYQVRVFSSVGGPLLTGAGLTVMTEPLSALETQQIDTLIAPGGSVDDTFQTDPQLVHAIQRHAGRARRVCSVCTGAFLLAAAGLLDGKRVTTHWDWAVRLQQQHPQIEVDPEPIFIRAGNIWTSAGVTAGIDLTLALIEQDYGHAVAIAVARQMVMFIKRPGGQSQFSVLLVSQSSEQARFDELHAWIAANLQQDLRVEALASRVNMTARTFARTYVAELGRTPAKTVEAMRLEAACRALEETDLPIKRIADDTGHGEEQNLRRVFQRQLGISPAQYRSRFSAH
ncbi:transcriptional regulator GlxA family with amidase domain [Herbaspirillum sp. Sphag1AN]|uniref:GlxA family transcriptional regulator n=1 Tax=unclassified Herbaspirillum TaxID=2624150 RepID=UPI00161C7DEA|nr:MULTISPECIES: DJ-1/PfpI family protein [unclassified Herbaspirillum]MBB3212155.1 transcriptional regulator GlxA family with amidase domain [Herbaspirillum sp. Sphag1AN]MBB3244011.1 transcriptional regulator GlxA family with amidase domain [Herbaspirillum sp. Sphag64]